VFLLLVGKWFQAKTYQTLSYDRDYKSYFPVAVTCINDKKTTITAIEDLKSSGRNYLNIIKVLSSSKYRLLKTYNDGTGKKVNLVHESIIKGWPLIKNSLVEYRKAIKQKDSFTFKLNEWIRLGKGEGGLLSKAEILEVEDQ